MNMNILKEGILLNLSLKKVGRKSRNENYILKMLIMNDKAVIEHSLKKTKYLLFLWHFSLK